MQEEGAASPRASQPFTPGCAGEVAKQPPGGMSGGKGRWEVTRHQGLGTVGHARPPRDPRCLATPDGQDGWRQTRWRGSASSLALGLRGPCHRWAPAWESSVASCLHL